MKDYLAAQVHGALNPAHGRNVACEYLQARLAVATRLREANWGQAVADVGPFR